MGEPFLDWQKKHFELSKVYARIDFRALFSVKNKAKECRLVFETEWPWFIGHSVSKKVGGSNVLLPLGLFKNYLDRRGWLGCK